MDYGYNIRGWLTSINDFASSSDLFALQLTYGEGDANLTTAYEDGNHANWNGNITMMEWKVKNHAQRHAYGFFYDRKNRLTSTTYSNRNAAGYFDWTYQYITSYSYDGNGNLLQLYRNGYLGSGLYGPIDNLAYTYTANGRLSAVQELGHLQRGFKTGSANGTYTYDGNGSLQSDGHKGISSIAYHHHQLPRRINWGNGNWLELTYDAAGVKRSQTTSTGSPVHYVEGIVYSGSTLRYLLHAEGQVAWVNNAYRYEYALSDHLGNRRVYFSDTNGDGVGDVLEENHYYPFGQALESDYFVGGANPYRYNGKERVDAFDLGWYDYGARWYAAELGRWGSVDPLADHPKQVGISPYAFVNNNPIRYVDPTGMIWENPKQAERLTKSVNNRIEGIEKNSTKIQAKIDEGGLSDKKLARLEGRLAENSQKTELLNQSLSDIEAIGNAAETFKLGSPSSSDGTHGVVKGADGVITIEGSNTGLHIHEIRHVGQSMKAGGLRFNKDGRLLNAAKVVNGDYTNVYGNEVNAYQTQYSYDGSYPGGASSLKDINIQSVKQIKDANGNPVYNFEKK